VHPYVPRDFLLQIFPCMHSGLPTALQWIMVPSHGPLSHGGQLYPSLTLVPPAQHEGGLRFLNYLGIRSPLWGLRHDITDAPRVWKSEGKEGQKARPGAVNRRPNEHVHM